MSEFEWVQARAECSIDSVFLSLKLGAESDMKARNALRPLNTPYEFTLHVAHESFSIAIYGPNKTHVTFQKNPHSIVVRNPTGVVLFEATLTLNDSGECRLKVNGQEREQWQFRKLALESLFFGTV